MRFLKYIKNRFQNGGRGSMIIQKKSNAVRLMEIELIVKVKPYCKVVAALEDLYEIHMQEVAHNKQEREGWEK
jgi:hypothetical protein